MYSAISESIYTSCYVCILLSLRVFTALIMYLVISESIFTSCYDIVDVINAYLLTVFIILQEKDSDVKYTYHIKLLYSWSP